MENSKKDLLLRTVFSGLINRTFYNSAPLMENLIEAQAT